MFPYALTVMFHGVIAMHLIGVLFCLVRMAADSDDRAQWLTPFGIDTLDGPANDYVNNGDAIERQRVFSKLISDLAAGNPRSATTEAPATTQSPSPHI